MQNCRVCGKGVRTPIFSGDKPDIHSYPCAFKLKIKTDRIRRQVSDDDHLGRNYLVDPFEGLSGHHDRIW